MFLWLWLIGWSAFALPLAIASLRGWAPKSARRRTTPWGIRVRGVALLVIWGLLRRDRPAPAGQASPAVWVTWFIAASPEYDCQFVLDTNDTRC